MAQGALALHEEKRPSCALHFSMLCAREDVAYAGSRWAFRTHPQTLQESSVVISTKNDGKIPVTAQATGASGENMRLVQANDVGHAADGIPIPFHPGAARYFAEKSVKLPRQVRGKENGMRAWHGLKEGLLCCLLRVGLLQAVPAADRQERQRTCCLSCGRWPAFRYPLPPFRGQQPCGRLVFGHGRLHLSGKDHLSGLRRRPAAHAAGRTAHVYRKGPYRHQRLSPAPAAL